MTNTSRTLRRAGAVALSLALAMSTLTITPSAAKKKVKFAKSKITVNKGKSQTVKIKGVKKKQIKKVKFKYSKKGIAKSKFLKKKGAVKFTGKKKGSTKVTAKVILKNKKKYNAKITVKVSASTPAPTTAPTTAPTVAPTAVPTATPVVSGTGVSIYYNGKQIQEKDVATGCTLFLEAKLTPEGANEPVTWTSANDKVASVVPSGTSAAIVTAGEKVGESTGITAKIGAAQATVVIKTVKNEITANIVKAEQPGAKEVRVTFDKDTKLDNMGFSKEKITVNQVADGKVQDTLHVNTMTVSADGTVADLTLDKLLVDQKDYEVVYSSSKEAPGKFKASVGAVVNANILVTEAQQKVPTPITFRLNDANGVNVTEAYDIDRTVTLTVEGKDVTTDNLGTPSKATLTMNTLKETATVKLTYVPLGGDATKDNKDATGVVTCVPTKETRGTAHFKTAAEAATKKWDNSDEGCAKFYRGGDEASLKLYTDSETEDLYFYASDAKGKAIAYDEYAVETTDNDIASATCSVSEGKYARITVTTGGKTGAPNLKVKATKYGVPTTYLLPITVVKRKEFTTLKLTPTPETMSNTYDEDYTGAIKAECLDGDGKAVAGDATITYEVTNLPDEPIQKWTVSKAEYTFDQMTGVDSKWLGFDLNEDGTFSAWGAKAQQYKIKATAEVDGIVKTATTTVTIKDIGYDAVNRYGKGVDVKYTPSVSDKVSLTSTNTAIPTRLEAYKGNLFLGYVDSQGRIGSTANINADYASTGGVSVFIMDDKKQNLFTDESKLVVRSYDVTASFVNGEETNNGYSKAKVDDGLFIAATTNGPTLNGTDVKVEEADSTHAANTVALTYTEPNGHNDFNGFTVTFYGTYDATNSCYTLDEDAVRKELKKVTAPSESGDFGEEVADALAHAALDVKATIAGGQNEDEFWGGSPIPFTENYITAGVDWDGRYNDEEEPDVIIISAEPTKEVMADAASLIEQQLYWALTEWDDWKFTTEVLVTVGDEIADFAITNMETGSIGWSTIAVNEGSRINGVTAGVKVGSKFASNGNLFNRKENATDKTAWGSLDDERVYNFYTTSGDENRFLIANEAASDPYFAATGKYTLTYDYYKYNSKKKTWEETTSNKDFEVVSDFYIPEVTAESRTADSSSEDDIIGCLVANCDLNCNDGENASIKSVVGKGGFTKNDDDTYTWSFEPVTTAGTSVSIRYVEVEEDGLTIYIPKSDSFTVAS